jgi:hypothetical protein
MSNCFASETSAVENAASSLVPVLGSLATAARSDIASLFGEVTSHIPGVITTIESAFSKGQQAPRLYSRKSQQELQVSRTPSKPQPQLSSQKPEQPEQVPFLKPQLPYPYLLSSAPSISVTLTNATSLQHSIAS